MTKLLSCPFCDEEPSFTDVELKDERRYAEKLLRCCSIEMSATLSFGQYKGLTDAQIDHQLRSELVKNWNTRAQPQGAPVTLEMLDAALDAWFRNNDKGMESGMRAAIDATLSLTHPERQTHNMIPHYTPQEAQ